MPSGDTTLVCAKAIPTCTGDKRNDLKQSYKPNFDETCGRQSVKMSDSPVHSMFSADLSPTSIPSGTTTLLTPTIVSYSYASPPSSSSGGVSSSSKPPAFTSPSSSTAPSSTHSGLSTILSASVAGGSKTQTSSSSSESSSQNSISVVPQNSPQNLSVVSGNVVIPQTLLQSANNSALLYHTGQGLVYATPTNLPEGVVLNLGQEQGNAQQQFITIPVSLSLTPAHQQQLIQGTSNQSSTFTTCSNRKDKSRK